MSERKEPGQLLWEAMASDGTDWRNLPQCIKDEMAGYEAVIYEDAATVARACFWTQVGGGRIVSRQASPDEVEAAIRAKIGKSNG